MPARGGGTARFQEGAERQRARDRDVVCVWQGQRAVPSQLLSLIGMIRYR